MELEKQVKRIEYLDTAKGILIIMLLWSHLSVYSSKLGVTNQADLILSLPIFVYVTFFMQTFFIITGFCSSFNIPFKLFVYKNIKTLLFPVFVFYIILEVSKIGGGLDISQLILGAIDRMTSGMLWFIGALFVSKLLFYVIHKYIHNRLCIVCLVLILYFVGIIIHSMYDIMNFYSWNHALLMLPFLMIGYLLKSYKTILENRTILGLLSLLFLFFIGMLYIIERNISFPSVDAHINVYLSSSLIHLILATTGSAMVLLCSIYMSRVKSLQSFFNQLGRNTLYIYLTQSSLLVFSTQVLSSFIARSTFCDGVLYRMLTFITVVTFYWVTSFIVETKWLKWMLGKF